MRIIHDSCLQRFRWFLLSCAAILCVLPAAVTAEPENKCLADALGREIRWDKAWQADGDDHDVVYRVQEVKRIKYPPAVAIDLVAQGEAKKTRREARITREHVERMFCQRLVAREKQRGVLIAYGSGISYTTRGKEINISYSSRDVVPDDLVFRSFHEGAWAPAKPRLGEKLAVCKLPTISYACSQRDYNLLERNRGATRPHYQPYYKMILPNGFIRYGAAGWRKSEPMGLPVESLMSECVVGNEKYSCLAEEKKKYEAELATLNRQLKLEQKIGAQP